MKTVELLSESIELMKSVLELRDYKDKSDPWVRFIRRAKKHIDSERAASQVLVKIQSELVALVKRQAHCPQRTMKSVAKMSRLINDVLETRDKG